MVLVPKAPHELEKPAREKHMATINLYASQINQMPGLIADLKRSVTDYKSELESMARKSLSINKSVCD
jgi:hypothetical protein